jgi:general secretion pathway protein F
MKDFQVKAVRGHEMFYFTISAMHLEDAFSQVESRGYTPISASNQSESFSFSKKNKFPLSLFSQELLALLDAGLNLVEAIETLAIKDEGNQVKNVLDTLLQSLYQGNTFSNALEKQSEIFPVLYISTVRASEKTGDLPESLKRYIAYEAQISQLKKKIISASIYPVLLMGVGTLVIIFLLGFVVPKFSQIYEGSGGELPWLSKILLNWGVFIENNGQLMLFCMLATVTFLITALSKSKVRKYLIRLLWRIPAIGKQSHIYQLARFYRTLGMLLKGGTSIIPALNSVAGLLETALQSNIKLATLGISEGQPLSRVMEDVGLTTPIASRMLLVGERSGNIGDMMERIASFYDEALGRWIEWFTRLFEPLLMLFIGLIIGVVVLLLYMPIFELAGNIQ